MTQRTGTEASHDVSEGDHNPETEWTGKDPELAELMDAKISWAFGRRLSHRPQVKMSPQDPWIKAVGLMVEHRVGAVVIVNDGAIVGIFTEADTIQAMRHEPETPVSRLMSTPVLSLSQEDRVAYAVHKLSADGSLRSIPIDEGWMVTARDLVELWADHYVECECFDQPVSELFRDRSIQHNRAQLILPVEVLRDGGLVKSTVGDAIGTMSQYHGGGIRIVDGDGRLVGFFSVRDVVKIVASGAKLGATIESVMSPLEKLVTFQEATGPDDSITIKTATELMVNNHVRHLIGVDANGKSNSVATIRDLIWHVAETFCNIVFTTPSDPRCERRSGEGWG